MNSIWAVFLLMIGASAMAFSTMYFYVKNREKDLKKKLTLFNTILSQLQEEKSTLIVKSENMFAENEAYQVHQTHLNEENRLLRREAERLEIENDRLKLEYKKLAEWLFEGKTP